MSVIVKGMKMPKNCNECDFCHWSNLHQTGICDRCGDEPVCPDYGTDYRRTRARFCPLVELPEKHGRLIDANVLIEELKGCHLPGAPYVDAGISIAIGKVCDAPTIIEAEGDEE